MLLQAMIFAWVIVSKSLRYNNFSAIKKSQNLLYPLWNVESNNGKTLFINISY